MSEARFFEKDNLPVISLKLKGGILSWQEWMCDSVSLLVSEVNENVASTKVVSFQTGTALDSVQIPFTDLNKLNDQPHFAIATDDISPANFYEGFLIKNEPIDLTGNFLKGISFQSMGEIDQAIEAYKQAIHANRSISRLHNLLGLCFRLKGNMIEAEHSYQRSLELNPHQAEALCNMGILYQKSGQRDKGLLAFKNALDKDPFYLNALIQFSKTLVESGNANDPILSSINLRLLSVYSDLPIVQDVLANSAHALRISGKELAEKLRSENSAMADSKTMLLLRRTENLRLNGAYFSALQGYEILLAKTKQTFAAEFISNWVSKKIKTILPLIPEQVKPVWNGKIQSICEDFPTVKAKLSGQEIPQAASPLTPKEFFAQTLVEMLRDGQIEEGEARFINQLRQVLKINDETYNSIFKSVSNLVQNNPMMDRSQGGAFNPKRLFSNLAKAVFRDGKVEEEEKKILVFASKAFGISSEDANKILSEARK